MRKYFSTWPDVFEYKLLEKPLKAESFPFLFVPMDSTQMYEDALEIVSPDLVEYWGQDVYKFPRIKLVRLLNTILISTVCDEIRLDNAVKSTHQCKQLFFQPRESKSIHFMAHTKNQGRFEIRIQNRIGGMNQRKAAEKRDRYLNKFHTLSKYYKKLKEVTDDCCPSYYRFRVCPDVDTRLTRVYEVEEFPGDLFIKEVFKDAQNHRQYEVPSDSEASTRFSSKQGSLPSYAYGFKLAKMAETLQNVRFDEIEEVGKIKYSDGHFNGTTLMEDFFESESEYFGQLVDEVLPVIRSNISEFEKDKVEHFEDI